MPRIRRAYQSDVNDPEPGSAKTRSQRLFAIGSVRLGVGRPNHLAPFLGISDKELPELGRSADGQRLFAIGSVRLGVGRPNHLAPFLGISDKELPELGRSADERCTT